MNSLVHADIFFFISTIFLVIIGIGIAIAVFYVIKIVRDVSHISTKVKEESDAILQDVKELRGTIKNQGFKMRFMTSFFKSIFKMRSKRTKSDSNPDKK